MTAFICSARVICSKITKRSISYVQGQSPKPRIREYFYFIDHQGQLFLDDARIKNFTSCFKEKQFLDFFFKRVKINDTGRYEEHFPYFSPCGRERNYVRCDDLPIVFTQLSQTESSGHALCCSGAPNITVKFEPSKVCMLPETGRIYHPAPSHVCGVGLIKSSIAIELSKHFDFDDNDETAAPPVWFNWDCERHHLTNEIIPLLEAENDRKKRILQTQV